MENTFSDVVVVGSIHMDYNIYLPRLPVKGETVIGRWLHISPGGKGANQAVAASRLGARTTFIGRVGNDENGKRLVEVLEQNNVDASKIIVDHETPTGIALIFIDESGDNMIAVFPGTDEKLSPGDIVKNKHVIENSKVLLLQLEIPLETVEQALKIAKEEAVITVLNVAPYKHLRENILSLVDVLILNDVEASQFSGTEITDIDTAVVAAKTIAEKTLGEVIVTLGEQGAVTFSKIEDRALHIPAFPVKAVDTVAAGDAFSAAYAVAISEEKGLEERLRFSVATASLKVTKKGAITGLPFRSEVERFLRSRGV